MTIVNVCLVVMLGIINMQYSHAQLLTDLNNNKLIKDFLNYFPNATVQRNVENVLDTTNINYLFPATGLLVNFTTPDQLLGLSFNNLEIAGKSFIGGTMEITITSRGTVARLNVPNNRTITGRISSIGVSESFHIP
ncbi:PREDICTED: uncharacterized protein LOC106111111 [Papilio polytes]|uniref:uncharacterized protein LOC106111111 n=1 Tax=Papilio polytes TaxID=76194 RepID=UPI00067693FF|nr:PREDICTED: uncharacterized protein LOC106111111 [Papilio polytes]